MERRAVRVAALVWILLQCSQLVLSGGGGGQKAREGYYDGAGEVECLRHCKRHQRENSGEDVVGLIHGMRDSQLLLIRFCGSRLPPLTVKVACSVRKKSIVSLWGGCK